MFGWLFHSPFPSTHPTWLLFYQCEFSLPQRWTNMNWKLATPLIPMVTPTVWSYKMWPSSSLVSVDLTTRQENSIEAVLPCQPAQGKTDNRDLWLLLPEILPSWNCHVREKRALTPRVEGGSSNKRLHQTLPGFYQSPVIWSIVHFQHLYHKAQRSPHCFRHRKVTSRPKNTTNEQSGTPLGTPGCQIQNNIKAMLHIPIWKVLLQPAPGLGDKQTFKLQPRTWEVLGRELVSHTQQSLFATVWKLTSDTPNTLAALPPPDKIWRLPALKHPSTASPAFVPDPR